MDLDLDLDLDFLDLLPRGWATRCDCFNRIEQEKPGKHNLSQVMKG